MYGRTLTYVQWFHLVPLHETYSSYRRRSLSNQCNTLLRIFIPLSAKELLFPAEANHGIDYGALKCNDMSVVVRFGTHEKDSAYRSMYCSTHLSARHRESVLFVLGLGKGNIHHLFSALPRILSTARVVNLEDHYDPPPGRERLDEIASVPLPHSNHVTANHPSGIFPAQLVPEWKL